MPGSIPLFTASHCFPQNIDGVVSRREILAAFRRNRQHADILKCPPRIRQDDGTFDVFVDRFLQVGEGAVCVGGPSGSR